METVSNLQADIDRLEQASCLYSHHRNRDGAHAWVYMLPLPLDLIRIALCRVRQPPEASSVQAVAVW